MNTNAELATTETKEAVVQVSPETITLIQSKLTESVHAAEEAMAILRAAAGPTPGKIPQDMITSINQGAGYLRVPRDTIRRMFREWEIAVRQATCQHDHGIKHSGKRTFCKHCEWEFSWMGLRGWQPMPKTGN